MIGGGIPIDLDPMVHREDLSATLTPLSGTHRYSTTISNISNIGAINSFQWYPPVGVRILRVLGSTEGRCRLTGLKGFGGSQFPTLVLYPNVLCDRLDLEAPSCTCLGDGGAVTIGFVTDKEFAGGTGRAQDPHGDPRFRPGPRPTSRPAPRRGAPGEAHGVHSV